MNKDKQTFMVITPLGLPNVSEIESFLNYYKVGYQLRFRLAHWPRSASLIYIKKIDKARLKRAMVYENLWRQYFKELTARVLIFDTWDDYQIVYRRKRELRACLNSLETTLFNGFSVCLHPFHLPDPLDVEQEYVQMSRYLILMNNHK